MYQTLNQGVLLHQFAKETVGSESELIDCHNTDNTKEQEQGKDSSGHLFDVSSRIQQLLYWGLTHDMIYRQEIII